MDTAQWVKNRERYIREEQIYSWVTLPGDFWSKVMMNTSGCWEWSGSKSTSFKLKYGIYRVSGATFPAHRVMYLKTYGSIPWNLEVHHECFNTLCVNPFHLRAVTKQENIAMSNGASAVNSRKTHCKRGHPLDGDNLITYSSPRPKRVCLTCQKIWQESQRKVKKENKNVVPAAS